MRPGRHRGALLLVAALAGGAVLVQELLAAGWIAPLYGSGLDVWAAVLATSLLALALGAWIGSHTASRLDLSRRVLDGLALGAAFLVIGAAFAARADPNDPPALGLVAGLLLGPPLVSFGALSPWIVERYALTGLRPGRAAGITYAAGTVGGAAGALLTAFALVPHLGLSGATAASVLALGLGGVGAAWLAGERRARALVLLLVLAMLVAAASRLARDEETAVGAFGLECIERVDGFYGRHEVLQDDLRRYLLVDGILQTAASRLGVGPPPPGDMLRAGNTMELALWLRPESGRALVIGVGGGALPGRLRAAGWDVDAAEIDPVVVDLARRHFGLRLPVHVEDGRRFLARRSAPYDLVLLDTYRGEHLPAHLFTEEAFGLVARRLGPDGLLAVNLIGTADGSDVLAIIRAVAVHFPRRALYAPSGGRTLGPMTLFASRAPVEDVSSRDRASADDVPWPERVSLESLPWETAARLTDDRSRLPLLRRDAARAWRELSRRRFATLKE